MDNINGWTDKNKMFPDMPMHEDGGPDILRWHVNNGMKGITAADVKVIKLYNKIILSNKHVTKEIMNRVNDIHEKNPDFNVLMVDMYV